MQRPHKCNPRSPASWCTQLEDATNILNYIFCFCFIGEMAVKISGLGLSGYFGRLGNCFDCAITLVGVGLV